MHDPRSNPSVIRAERSLRYERDAIESAERGMLDAIAGFRYPEASLFALRLAFEEAVMNAFRHGHKNLPPDATVRLVWEVSPERTVIEVEDQGPGFKAQDVPDPTLDANLEVPSGRGIMLMRAYMTDVRFNERGNQVVMTYDRMVEESRRRV